MTAVRASVGHRPGATAIGDSALQRRRARVAVAVVTVAAFGPYLAAGLRTEQVAVYAAALVVILLNFRFLDGLNHHGALVGTFLGAQLAIAGVGAAWPPANTTPYANGSPIAGLDNLALPLAVLALTAALVAAGADRMALARTVCVVTVWAMVVNALLAVSAVVGAAPYLAAFHNMSGIESVSDRAEQMGRYSGLFNQPAEAGTVYSIALIAAIYLYRRRPVLLTLIGTALTVGGILTVSKVFLLVGLPVTVWQAVRVTGNRTQRVAVIAAAVLVMWVAAGSQLLPEWGGQDFLLRLLPSADQNAVELYSGGRFGSDATLTAAVEAVLATSPTLGFGAGGLQVAYDNGWVEALAVAGVVGVAIHTAILAVLVGAWWRQRAVDVDLSRFSAGLITIVIGASFGVPALTVNRVATVGWLLLGLVLLCASRPRHALTSPA